MLETGDQELEDEGVESVANVSNVEFAAMEPTSNTQKSEKQSQIINFSQKQ